MTGDIKPGTTLIILLIPSMTLAKLGLISMKLASGPVDTAPLTAVATVENTMAAVALQPEKESPSVNKPWPMVHAAAAIFRTFVRDMKSFLSR